MGDKREQGKHLRWRKMNFFLETPSHWIMCEVLSAAFGVVTFRLWGDDRIRRGKGRKNNLGWLITEAK